MSFLALPRDHERGREDISIPITCTVRRKEYCSKRDAVRAELNGIVRRVYDTIRVVLLKMRYNEGCHCFPGHEIRT